MKLPAPVCRQAGTRQEPPGNADMITGLAFTPVLESVSALPAGASGRLARDGLHSTPPLSLFASPETAATLHVKKSDRNKGQMSKKCKFLWIAL